MQMLRSELRQTSRARCYLSLNPVILSLEKLLDTCYRSHGTSSLSLSKYQLAGPTSNLVFHTSCTNIQGGGVG